MDHCLSNNGFNNHTFGIIRVVPEMDHVLSLHGIGWPNDYHFSRKYFKVWIGLHQYLFRNQTLLRSNCRDNNFGAMNVLLKMGMRPGIETTISKEKEI